MEILVNICVEINVSFHVKIHEFRSEISHRNPREFLRANLREFIQ